MNMIIEILSEKNKKKDSNIRYLNNVIVYNDCIIDYLSFDITI